MKKKLKIRSILLLLPILILSILLSFLIVNRSQSYYYYERIEFECAGGKIHANLYYPNKNLDFQEKSPLVIYVHGFSSQKDIDLRLPIELTKRGFFVACVDMPGHGESIQTHLLKTDEYDKLEMTQVCSKLLNKIENLGYYKYIDVDQIGLVGHSLGGYVVLMNGLYDDRFKATITWAGVTDVIRVFKGADISKDEKHLLHENNPEEIMNNDTKKPENLLLIDHKEDPFFKDNKKLQNITKCEMEKLTYPVNSAQEAHLLLHKDTTIKTIEWLEKKFFDSKTKNGPIQISVQSDYLLIILTLVLICFTTLSLMIYISKYVLNKERLTSIKPGNNKENRLIFDKKKQILIVFLSIAIFVSIWIFSYLFPPIFASTIASLLVIILFGYLFKKIIRRENPEKKEKLKLKDQIKSKITLRSLLYATICSGIFLGLYFAFALFYPFALYYPHSLLAFALAIIYFPIFLSTEIFYRKAIFPTLDFIKSRKNRTYFISIIIFCVQIFLLFQLGLLYQSYLLVAGCAFLFSSLMNSILYHKTEDLGAVLLNSFIICGIFFGAVWSFYLNLIAIII